MAGIMMSALVPELAHLNRFHRERQRKRLQIHQGRENVGSLVRPPEVREVMAARENRTAATFISSAKLKVSHATNVVEHPELIAWRIGNFAAVVGRENVIAGTDCGFS